MKVVIVCALMSGCAAPTALVGATAPVVAVAPPAESVDAGGTDPDSEAGTRVPATGSQQKLELRWGNGWNLHYAGNRGAEHLDARGSVTMELRAGGRSTAVDSGKRDESVLDGARYTEKSTVWRVTWHGTWARNADKLRVDLARDQASCALTLTERQGATQYLPSKSACTAGVEHLLLECDKGSVDAAPSSDDLTTKPTPTPVWICHPPVGVAPAIGTAFSWVFGTGQCLERSGGAPRTGPLRYAHCRAP